MKTELKEAWTSALRSGLFAQGQHKLKALEEEDSRPVYCCLGVLCFGLQGHPQIEIQSDKIICYDDRTNLDDKGTHESLSKAILDEVELSSDQESELISMNDDKGFSFDEIASWIEENL